MNEWIRQKSISAVPLNALLAFEAVARLMSIKAAALELNLTPSAISHRLRLLEKVLGCKLVGRVGSQLELTEIGRSLAPPLSAGFAQIMHAVGDVIHNQPPAAQSRSTFE
jgi:LysR family glycine cleavage system transcriptional activator